MLAGGGLYVKYALSSYLAPGGTTLRGASSSKEGTNKEKVVSADPNEPVIVAKWDSRPVKGEEEKGGEGGNDEQDPQEQEKKM